MQSGWLTLGTELVCLVAQDRQRRFLEALPTATTVPFAAPERRVSASAKRH
jgi:hypothetical protein